MAKYKDPYNYKSKKTKPIRMTDKRLSDETARDKHGVYTKNYNPDLIHDELLNGTTITHDLNPENPRFRFHHSTGTGCEILKDGSLHLIVNGNAHEYFKEGMNITVQGNVDTKIGGHSRTSTSGGSHDEVKGDRSSFTAGGRADHTAGNHSISVGAGGNQGGTLSITAEKSITLGGATGGSKEQSPIRISIGKDGTMYITTSKHVNIDSGTDVMINAGGKIGFRCAGGFSIDAGGDINIAAGGQINMEAQSSGNFKSGGEMKISGSDLKMSPLDPDFDPAPGYHIKAIAEAGGASPDVTNYKEQEKPAVAGEAPKDTIKIGGNEIAPSFIG